MEQTCLGNLLCCKKKLRINLKIRFLENFALKEYVNFCEIFSMLRACEC